MRLARGVLKGLQEHLSDLVGLVPARTPTRMSLSDALGCVLAEDICATRPIPSFASSAMDGYAIRVADVPGRLDVTSHVAAGQVPDVGVRPGTAVKVMTGALIPEGAEAVVPIEVVEDEGTSITVAVAPTPGAHVRFAGSDAPAGATLLAAGTVITAARVALLASVGAVTPLVRPRPRVLVVSTGDELVDAGVTPGPAQLVDSNRPALLAAVREAGCLPIDGGRVSDQPGGLLEVLEAGEADLVVTSGGVSVGDHDVVKAALLALPTVHFERVAVQPGMPQAWGHLPGGRPFLGLPGNPVSALVSWELFGRAALGLDRRHDTRPLAQDVTGSPADKHQLLRGRLAGGEVVIVGGPGSHLLVALGQADLLVIIPAGVEALAAGAMVDVIDLGGPVAA